MVGLAGVETQARDDDDEWLVPMLDEIILMARQEDVGISEEREWTTELLGLRRWLADDRLRPELRPRDDSRETEREENDTQMVDDDGEENALMQRRRPPWETWRKRSRSNSGSRSREGRPDSSEKTKNVKKKRC